jgi:multidrug efflux pump subunit AcrB
MPVCPMRRVSGGFVPVQDKDYLVGNVQLPDSASMERTVEVIAAVERIALETPGWTTRWRCRGSRSS